MTVRLTLSSLPPLARLEPLWRDLERRSAATAFLRWSWVHARLAQAPAGTLLIAAHEGDGLVALAFGVIVGERRLGLWPARVLYLNDLGNPAQDIACVEYNDFLMPAGREEALRPALFSALAHKSGFDALFVRSCLPEVTPAVSATGLDPLVRAAQPSWAIDLTRPRAVLDGLSANTRQQVRRAMRLYESDGALSCRSAGGGDEALRWIEELARLHAARWGRADLIGTPYRRFIEALVLDGLEDGTVEIVRVAAGAAAIGYLVNLIDDTGVRFYLGALAYDGDARRKPGLVAHALCAQRCADAGHGSYDFLAGDARYKAQLGDPGPILSSVLFRRPHLLVDIEDALRAIKRRWRHDRGASAGAAPPD